MLTKLFIGNDIVDLNDPHNSKKYKNERFINRILAPSEIYLLNNSKEPHITLWSLWSGKEATYKALKKIDSKIVFAHSKIEIVPNKDFTRGTVNYNKIKLNLSWEFNKNWIHCIAVNKTANIKNPVIHHSIKKLNKKMLGKTSFSQAEKMSIKSDLSEGVRVLAKSLLTTLNFKFPEIIRQKIGNRFSPPQVYENGTKAKNLDISLSHDGEFISCTIILL